MNIDLDGTGICDQCGYPTWQELEYEEQVLIDSIGRWQEDEYLPIITEHCDNCGAEHSVQIDISYALQLIGQYAGRD